MALSTRALLGWRLLAHDKVRLVLSVAGIAFAVLLMFAEMGFLNGVFDSETLLIRRFNADLLILNRLKTNCYATKPIPRARLSQALAVEGVAAADALYLEWPLLRNTAERREYLVVALAYDTDRDVLLLPEVVQNSAALRRPETILVDKTSRRFCYGELGVDTPVEINRRRVRVVGTFSLFPNFSTDGHVVMRDQTLFALYADPRARQARENLVDFGLVRVRPGFGLEAVRLALAAALPDDVAVLSKAEMVRRVEQRWATSQPVVPVFGLGMLIGFIIGIMICYQILFTDIEDHRAEMATLKAMGYGNGYLVRVVLQEALTLALLAFLPGLLGSALLYRVLQDLTGVLMEITAPRAGAVLALTVAMCLVSALIAIRKVLRADPAEVF